MSLLICIRCNQVPYIEFNPGLHIKFMCCETKNVRHFDLDEFIEQNYTLKCQKCSCPEKDGNIILYSKKLICNACHSKIKTKNKDDYTKTDSIPNKCPLNEYKKYEFYDTKTHMLCCQYCLTKNALPIKDFEKSIKIEKISIQKNSYSHIPYFDKIGNRITKTYEIMKKTPAGINSYLNLLNFKNFLEDYSTIVPLCHICKEIYNINLIENTQNNSFEISCKCGKNIFSSVIDFENKIATIKCDMCEKEFKQKNMFLDFLTEDILCESCLNEKSVFDYIRYSEIPYVCNVHTNKFILFCNTCGKFLCDKCDIENHNLIKIEECRDDNGKKYEILSKSKWFMKLKNEGLLNLKSERIIHENKNNNKLGKFQEYKTIIENKEKKGLDELSNKLKFELAINLGDIKFLELKFSNFASQVRFEEELFDLKSKLNKMTLSIELLFKEFSDKNKIVQLLKTRNILQHIFTKIIMNNYECFENIEGDFRVLYESYKYLNYEKKNCDEVKSKIESIFEKFERLIKSHVKKNVKNILVVNLTNELEKRGYKINKNEIKNRFDSNDNEKNNFDNIVDKLLPLVPINDRIQIFNNVFESPIKKAIDNIRLETIKGYNNYLLQQNAFTPQYRQKNKEALENIEKILDNKIPKDYEKSGLFKKSNLTENEYLSEIGYLNEDTLDKNLIKTLLQNSQKDENFHYLLLKNDKSEEFLKKVGCEKDAEFYFLFMLSNRLIRRIGKIIHQNDAIFQFLFYNFEDNLNIENYSLINEKDKKEPKFKIYNKNANISLKNLTFQKVDISSIFKFTEELVTKNFSKMCDFLGENEVATIKKEINGKFEDLDEINKIKNEIDSLENEIEKYILFINNYKEIFVLFPQIKQNIAENIERNSYPSFKEVNYMDEKNENYFVNMFSDMYTISIYFLKKREYLMNKIKKYDEKYKSLLQNYYRLEIAKRIYNLLKSELNKDYNELDYFEQEKKAISQEFLNFFAKEIIFNPPKKLTKKQKEIFQKRCEIEKKKFEDAVEKLKNISLNDIGLKFKNYIDFDILSFTQTKFDVILFLCQNKYI